MIAAHSSNVTCIQLFANGTRSVSAGGKQVCVWSEADGALVWRTEADRYEVNTVLAHSSGSIISAGSYGTVAVLEGDSGAIRHRVELGQPAAALFELPDGRVVVGDEEYEDLRVLDPRSGELIELDPQGEQGRVVDVRIEGSRLHAVNVFGGCCTYDLETFTFEGRTWGPSGEAIGFVPGRERVLSISEAGAYLWDPSDGTRREQLAFGADPRVAIDPRGARLALANADSLHICSGEGELERTIALVGRVRLLRFSSDGRTLASVIEHDTEGGRSFGVVSFDAASGSQLCEWTSTVWPRALAVGSTQVVIGLNDGTLERVRLG